MDVKYQPSVKNNAPELWEKEISNFLFAEVLLFKPMF